MSTRKDGLSLGQVHRTVTYLISTCGVEISGGNRRVLELQRRDGEADIGAARNASGLSLEDMLAGHGFTLRQRRGVTLIDLMQCDHPATAAERERLIEQLARSAGRDARADGGNLHDYDRAYETEARWCEQLTAHALRRRASA